MSVISMPLSRALHMSYTVSAAADTATSASISTPAWDVVVTREATSTPFLHSRAVTSMCVSNSGCQRGIHSAVRFAAAIPAIRAISRGFPLGSFCCRRARNTAGGIRTKPLATAVRSVTAFAVTSTMATSPRFRKCVSFRISPKVVGARHAVPLPMSTLYRAAPRQDVHPLAHGNLRSLGANHQEGVSQRQRNDIARPLPGQLRDSRFPALPLDSCGQEMGHWTLLVDRRRKLAAKDRQRPGRRATQQINGGQHKQFERHHGRDWIPRQPEDKLPSARREHRRPAGTYGDASKMKFRTQVAQHLLHQIIFAHRYAAGENQNVRLQPAFDVSSERD